MKHKYAKKRENISSTTPAPEEEVSLDAVSTEATSVVADTETTGVCKVLVPNRKWRQILIIAAVAVVFVAALAVGIYFLVDHNRTITIKFECSVVNANVEDITLNKGETPEMPVLQRAGYVFLGWYDEEDRLIDADFFRTYDFLADIVVHDKWSIGESVVVTYVTRGGTPLDPVEVPRGYALDQVGQTERSGYQFMGWCYDEQCLHVYNPDFQVIDDNVTFYAKWLLLNAGESDTVKVYFDTAGGSVIEQREVPVGTAFDYAETFMAGHEFDGWYSDDAYLYPVDPSVILTQTCTLFAKWRTTDRRCRLSFVADAPVEIEGYDLPIYTQIDVGDVPKPTVADYTLEGLYVDNLHQDVAEFPLRLERDTTLYLHYVSTVVVDVDVYFYETENDYVICVVRKDALVPYLDPPQRNGYYFDNWYADPDYNTVFDFEHTKATQGLCIYAHWLSDVVYADQYFVYALSDDGTYLIADSEVDASRRNVVIPATCMNLPVKVIRAGLFDHKDKDEIQIGSNVVEIGEGAFDSCTVKSIVLPSSVRQVGNRAFNHAYYLEFVVAEGRVAIGEEAFKDCTSLTTVEITKARSVGNRAFANCGLLTTVRMTYMSGHVDSDYATLGENMFDGCVRLATVDISQARIYEIPIRAFRGTKLSSIELSNSVKILRNACFEGTPLVTFNTNNVETIEPNVFNNCVALREVTIGKGLVNLQTFCFGGCGALERFVVPMSHSRFAATTQEDGCLYNADKTKLLLYVGVDSEYTLPATVTSFSDEAFLLASNLRSLQVSSLTYFKADGGNLYTADGKTLVFYAPAQDTTTFVVPEGVETLRSTAFYESGNLQVVRLSSTVRTFNPLSFYALAGLVSIECVDDAQAALVTVSTGDNDYRVVYQCPNAQVSVIL